MQQHKEPEHPPQPHDPKQPHEPAKPHPGKEDDEAASARYTHTYILRLPYTTIA